MLKPITHFVVLMLPVSMFPTWISVTLSILCVGAVAWAIVGEMKR